MLRDDEAGTALEPGTRTFDFSEVPFIVIWEMTRACALKCVHCRAQALDRRDPGELTTGQAYGLLDEIKRFQAEPGGPTPLVVLTGGDPMRRPDALDIVRYGTDLGLRVAMTPSGTDEITRDSVKRLKSAGLKRLAVSLDGSNECLHDSFRKVRGSYDWTMQIIQWANEIGLPVQINTTITRHNRDDIGNLVALMESMSIVLWSVFFLIPVGRGRIEDALRGADYERVFHKMYDLSRTSAFDVKSTEAPHYRRFVVQRRRDERRSETTQGIYPMRDGNGKIGRSAKGVNAGNGFVFISHVGEVQPSGFLPISAGNVKRVSLVHLYRNSGLFRMIRDYSKLKGKCGVCEYQTLCGGSRSQAFAILGDYMASDPFCVYVPKGYTPGDQEKKFW